VSASPGVDRYSATPRGVLLSVAFFVLSGVLEIALSLHDAPRPVPFAVAWQATGAGLLHFLLAWGLWRRIALCRSVAMVYCLAVIVTYLVALALALAHAPLRFPPSVVVQSLFQVPSCVLLFPFLRSAAASALFPRPLLGP
jgi:predicted neutral ceramidase superfamily lipid hydrolase